MKYHYDLHIHSCLSPCGSEDMSPVNIVNMAHIKGLDIVAITDHNTIKNCEAGINAARDLDLLVLPGMEVESKEEVHTLCLFPSMEDASKFDKLITSELPDIPLNESFFGRQIICNEKGEIVEKVSNLLSTSINLGVNDIISYARECNGVGIPAHIDKSNYSIISNLGFIPPNLNVNTVEISKNGDREKIIKQHKYLKDSRFICNSDAHYLVDISERGNSLELPELSAEALIECLNSKVGKL